MENNNIPEEIEPVNGLLFLPQNADSLPLGQVLKDFDHKIQFYDSAKHNDENLNFKFLLPAIETAKEENMTFILGFDSELKRMIIGYPNEEGKYLVFNAHQQAALLTDFFLQHYRAPDSGNIDTDPKLIVKGIILSQQIDKIVVQNGGRIKDSLAGYENLREIIESNREENQLALGFDEWNSIVMHPDTIENVISLVDLVKQMVNHLSANVSSLYFRHVELQIKFKLYGEKSFNISSEGQNKKIFDRFRLHPPSDAINEELVTVADYKKGTFVNKLTGRKGTTDLGQLDLVQLEYSSGLKITVELTDNGKKLFLHLSDFIDCYNKPSFPEARKNIHDRLLKVVVSLGKMVINVN